MRMMWVCMAALCLLAGAAHVAADMNGTWVNETVSGWGPLFGSLVFDSAGNPCIGYGNVPASTLTYANKSGGVWHTDLVDYPGGLFPSLAFDPSGNPALSSLNYAQGYNHNLRYSWIQDGSWNTETVDSVGILEKATSLAFNNTGSPCISYFNYTGRTLKYATKSGETWVNETVATSAGWDSSLAFDGSGNPSIAYVRDGGLNYSRKSGETWENETVDTSDCKGVSLVFDRAGNPCITYIKGGCPRYAQRSGGTWINETADPAATCGVDTSLAFDWAGNPGIGYLQSDPDAGTLVLKYSHKYGGVWENGIVALSSYTILEEYCQASLAFDRSGNPCLTYTYVPYTYDDVGYQNYTWYVPPPPNVTSISPGSGKRGKIVKITGLNGTGYLPGAKPVLVKGMAKIKGKAIAIVNETWIRCTFRIPAAAATGMWNVMVTNADGKSGLKKKAFRVKA